MERIDGIVDKTLNTLGLRKKMKEVSSMSLWPQVVGELIASKTRPTRVRGSRLWVEVSSSAWMSELLYLKPTLIARINKSLGDKVIKDIVFTNKGE
jgi:predicted nucleic acid-binding Zn ribbon protein